MALGAAVLLVGCSAQSPTAPKPTPIPAFNISLTPASTTATAGSFVAVVAQVNSGSGNAADGTAVTFDVTGGHFDVKDGTGAFATEVVRTTASGRASVNITADTAGQAAVLGRVTGDSDQTTVTFTGVAPTPTPTPTPTDQPQIYALTPNAGPFEGGTRVTISGVGFQAPVQVLFDDIQAQVVSTSYREVVCISPSITPTAPDTVITKQVTVTNIGNGKKSTGVGFRYGVTMFISSFSPMEGPADTPTTVTIFGQGFVAPVSVVATIGVEWDVLSVSGTELVVKTRPLPVNNPHQQNCGPTPTTFTVTNVGSNTSYTSTQEFTYRSVVPFITSVQIDSGTNTVQQYVPVAVPPSVAVCSTPWGNHRVTIRGSGFQQGMTVNFDGLAPVPTTFVDATTLTLAQLPDLTSVGLERISCTTGAGACGNRFIPTQVGITVNNPRNGCSDTLNNAVVINPCDNSCLVTSVTTLSVTPAAGTKTVGVPFSVSLGFTPTPSTASVTVNLTYAGFTATPTTVTIPPTSSPWPVQVTATSPVTGGSIIASVGSGSCTVTAASGLITVIAAAPTVASVTANTGPVAGGTSVAIAGTNFATSGTVTVTFGGTPATGVVVGTSTTLSCTTPAHVAGPINVVVTNPDAQSGTLINGFTYTADMDVTISGTGTVTSTPAGINCSTGTCSFTFNVPSISLGVSTTGTFNGWTGATCPCNGNSNNPCNPISMDQNRACTATFTP
jgi:hypothetical protein